MLCLHRAKCFTRQPRRYVYRFSEYLIFLITYIAKFLLRHHVEHTNCDQLDGRRPFIMYIYPTGGPFLCNNYNIHLIVYTSLASNGERRLMAAHAEAAVVSHSIRSHAVSDIQKYQSVTSHVHSQPPAEQSFL